MFVPFSLDNFILHLKTYKQDEDYRLINHYSVSVGALEKHMDMNRYTDILPYDRTRTVVYPGTGVSRGADGEKVAHARYLNANWVLELFGHKWWIAAQAPLKQTAHAFLSAMIQSSVHPPNASPRPASGPGSTRTSRIRTVVQLTRNVESGRKKADVYFPSEVGQFWTLSPEQGCSEPALKVTLLDKKTIEEAHCVQSTVSVCVLPHASALRSESPSAANDEPINLNDQEIVFQHLLYMSWPDHGVPGPEDRESLMSFIRLVDATNRDKSLCRLHLNATPDHLCTELDPDPPIVIGCSAGVGRTGSFIAISSLLRKYGFLPPAAHPTLTSALHSSLLGPLPSELQDDKVLQEIDSLREQRPGMVQKDGQSILVYEILISMFTKPNGSH